MNFIRKKLFNYLTAGETIKSLECKINVLEKQNLFPIVDYIKESATSKQQIKNSLLEYNKLVHVQKADYIALKLSSLGYQEQTIEYLVNTLLDYDKKIMIDAEDIQNQDKVTRITNKLIDKYNNDEVYIYKTYQMYRRDSLTMLNYDINNTKNLGVKLVRGAYYNQDYQSGRLFETKDDTDNAYEKAMNLIFESNNTSAFICTHNYNNINQLINYMSTSYGESKNDKIFHASLYGFIPRDTKRIIKVGITTYKYLPYGNMDDAIPYLSRRVYENPKVLFYMLT